MPNLTSIKKWYERPKNATTAKYRLRTDTGLCASSSNFSLYKYAVTAGEILYLNLLAVVISDVSYPVYQWQSASDVPASGTNSALIGTPVKGAIDGFVTVPEGATWLIVSQLTATTTVEVRATILDGDSISNIILPNEVEYKIKDKTARATVPFGTTDFSSTSTAFTAIVEGITELKSGVACYIMNTKVASATNCTININNLGAKPMYLPTAAATRVTTQFSLNYTWLLVYNEHRVAEGCWDLVYLYNTNTTYSSMTEAEYEAGTSTTARLISPVNLKTAAGLWGNGSMNVAVAKSAIAASDIIVGDTTGYEKMAAGVEFDLAYPIMYANSAAAANTVVALAVREYHNKTLRNNLGSSWTGTPYKMVWLIGTLSQFDHNKFIIDQNIVTQTIPTEPDGLYYLPLGIMQTSGYQLAFSPKNELWAFCNGAFRRLSDYIYDIVGDIETLLAAI